MWRRNIVHLPNWVGLRGRSMASFAAISCLFLTDLLIKPVGIPVSAMATSYESLDTDAIPSSTFNTSGMDMGILLHRWDLDEVFHLIDAVFTDWHPPDAAYLGYHIGRQRSLFYQSRWALGLITSPPIELTDPWLDWLSPQGPPDLRAHIHTIHQMCETCHDPSWCVMHDARRSREDVWSSGLVRWVQGSWQKRRTFLAFSPDEGGSCGAVAIPPIVSGPYCTIGVWLCDVVFKLYRSTTSVLEIFSHRRLPHSLLPRPLSLLFHFLKEPLIFVGLTLLASFGLAYLACSQRRLVKGRQQQPLQRLAMRVRSLIFRTLTGGGGSGGGGGGGGSGCSWPGSQTAAMKPRGSLVTTTSACPSACPTAKRAAAVVKSKALSDTHRTVAPGTALCAVAVATARLIATAWPWTFIQRCKSTARFLVRRRPPFNLAVGWGRRLLAAKSWVTITSRWWPSRQQQQKQELQEQQQQRKSKRSGKRGSQLHTVTISPTPPQPSAPQEQLLPQQQQQRQQQQQEQRRRDNHQQQEKKQQTVQPQPTIVRPKLGPAQSAKQRQPDRTARCRDVQEPHHDHRQLQSYRQTGQRAFTRLGSGHQTPRQTHLAPVWPHPQQQQQGRQQIRQEDKGPQLTGCPAAQGGWRLLPAGQSPASDSLKERSSRGGSSHSRRAWSRAGSSNATRGSGTSASSNSSRTNNGGYGCPGWAGGNTSIGAGSRGGVSGHDSTGCSSGSTATAVSRVLGTYDVPCEAPLREGPPSGPIGRKHHHHHHHHHGGHNVEMSAPGSSPTVLTPWAAQGPGLDLRCAGMPAVKPMTGKATVTAASTSTSSASAASCSASSASAASSVPPSPPSPLLACERSGSSSASFSNSSNRAASNSRSTGSCDLGSTVNGSIGSCSSSSLTTGLAVGFGAGPHVRPPLGAATAAAASIPYYPAALTIQPCRTTPWLQPPPLTFPGSHQLRPTTTTTTTSTTAVLQQLLHAPISFSTREPVEVAGSMIPFNFSPNVATGHDDAADVMAPSIQRISVHLTDVPLAVISATQDIIDMGVQEPPPPQQQQQQVIEYKELPTVVPSIWSTLPDPRRHRDPYGAPQGWKPWAGAEQIIIAPYLGARGS
ncbi:hypothetical protein VaNZ11_005833 [Volvox africanus]|uniref:Uncharacterized protein n=1 Tax=Volvox africanus TaxID=51714 RepID=A0ABQ5S131_9CHLO|nr:hypothetical protein VaNZ11_005833 [Volvox africanus]